MTLLNNIFLILKSIPHEIQIITLTFFPFLELRASIPYGILVLEMNNGQMIDDVQLARVGTTPVHHYGKGGGWKPTSKEVYDQICRLWRRII